MTTSTIRGLVLLSALAMGACSSVPEGPVVPTPPCVETQFASTLITPEGIRFVGKVVIRNVMRGPLAIEKVDYQADLHDRQFVDESFAELTPMGARDVQTVTVPIFVSMQDLRDQAVDLLAEESVRVTLRGVVFPVGFEPIEFANTAVVPIPKTPVVAFVGSTGNPLDGEMTVRLSVRNPNAFPLTFRSVESHVRVNGKRYPLLESECFRELAPGATGVVALRMEHTRGKGISILVNMIEKGSADLAVGGLIQCQTPYGLFHLPVEVGSAAASPGR